MAKRSPATERFRILVTGLNGIIGWNVFNGARDRYEVFGTYRKRHAVLKGQNLFRIDLLDGKALDAMIEKSDPHYIIHSWAMCDLDICESFPEMAEKINVRGTELLLQSAEKSKRLKKFVYVSTDHTLDGEKGNYAETDVPSPKHVYGKTKLKAEKIVMKSGLPYLIIRPGLVIGKSFQGNKGPRDFLFTRIRLGKPTHYFTDEWRSPIEAEDLASEILDSIASDKNGVIHLAGENVFSRYELAVRLAENEKLPTDRIYPRLREEDAWAHIRPRNISLKSRHARKRRIHE